MDEFGTPLTLHDFIDDPNFDQFIDLIRGENEDPVAGFDCDLINGCFSDTQFGSIPENVFDFDGAAASTLVSNDLHNVAATTLVSDDLDVVFNTSLPILNGDIINGGDQEEEEEEEEEEDGDDYSGTTTRTSKNKNKVDRSRTLISERKRRGNMKEKLFALRALVPNITKMDKASIVGDAVSYVQELQIQAKQLKAEIDGLEASLAGSERYQESIEKQKRTQVLRSNQQIYKKIMQMDVFQVEERGFYLKLVSNKGEGVAVTLYKALESLTSFNVQNFNFAAEPERLVLTCSLNVKDCEQNMNLASLKLWVTDALLNQGFEVVTPFLY